MEEEQAGPHRGPVRMEGMGMMTHQWEVGKEYKTRVSYVATILDVNFKGCAGESIIGKVKIDGREIACTWDCDGFYWCSKTEHPYDLMPPVETKELWINVYDEFGGIWSNKEVADKHAADTRIGLLKITITGDKFEVEKVAI